MFAAINVLNAGISSSMPFDESRRVRLVNISALLASGTTIPYIFIFFSKDVLLGSIALGFFFSFCSCWLLNKHRFYNLARITLYLFSCAYLFIVASSLGREASHHLMLIPVLLSVVVVFEFREKAELFSMIGLVLVSFLTLELTDFSLFSIDITPEEQRYFYYGSLSVAVLGTATIGVLYFYLYGKQLQENRSMLKAGEEIEQTINYFSTSLFGKNSVDEILWDVAKNCIGRLGFVDCVIYLLDEERNVLVQKAAYGHKNPHAFEIYKPMDIPVGNGIVGNVAKSKKAVVISDTSRDARYIADDENRLSELAVPLIYNHKVIGVIDSEHPEKNFFTLRHLNVLKTISSLCANKVARAIVDEENERALKLKSEAEKIKAFDELKSKLFANVSHELRTPLTLIMGTIDRHVDAEDDKDWLVLQRHTDRLLRLINQLLDLTKLESGQLQLHPKSADIMGFLRMIISLFSSTASHRNITLTDNVSSTPLWLDFDQDALEKILFNLLSNAVKFTRNGSIVDLTISFKDKLTIAITDQGEGIPRDELDKIFDRFYQAGKPSSSGTGIGLALTKELIDLHGGTIAVESEPGEGATFTVTIPMRPSENIPLEPDEKTDPVNRDTGEGSLGSPSQTNSQFTILLVEDNQELSDYIKSELSPDFKILQSYDGEEAQKMVEDLLPDLIISDIMMPRVGGLEFAEWLKGNEITNHLPIILLTARADFDTKLQGLQTGADDYIVKPFNSEELRTRIENLLHQRELLKQKFAQVVTLSPKDIVITRVEEVFIKRLLAFIDENLSNNDLNAELISQGMGMSRMQLHRKLSTLTGYTTSSFLRYQRLLHAARKLDAGDTVSQSAYASGFSSLSYFSKVFKDQFGILPSEYEPQRV